jgi:hypothetical protein
VYLWANATRDRRLIPTKDRRLALIQSCHRDSGHYGIQRTESLLTKQYSWANMRAKIQQYIDSCETCAKFQAKFNTDPKLHSIPVTPSAWHSLGIDVVGPYPTSATGKRNVVIAVDYFTKLVEAVAMKTQGSAETAAFLTGIIDRFGAPSISGQTKAPTSKESLPKYWQPTWWTITCPEPTIPNPTDLWNVLFRPSQEPSRGLWADKAKW